MIDVVVIVKAGYPREFDIATEVTELFNKIPVTNYKVKVVYNEVKDAYRLVFITDVFKIVIAILRQD